MRQTIHNDKNLKVCLPWYYTPPSQKITEWASRGLGAGTFFGPIHEVEVHGSMIAVLVPTPWIAKKENESLPELVWINFYRRRKDGEADYYCEVVSEDEVQQWLRNGWKDRWVTDGMTAEDWR